MMLATSAAATKKPAMPTGPEVQLAGINIETGTIDDAKKLYGPPETMIGVPEPYPAGTHLYKWGRLLTTLKILTEPAGNNPEKIAIIVVEGNPEPEHATIDRTGRGLKLGTKLSDVKKLYGNELQQKGNEITLRWPNATTLIIGLDDRQRVNRLELRAAGQP